MMIDISPQLLEKIEEEFGKRFYSDPKVKRIYAKIQIGTADYIDANKLSGYMGKHLAKAIETVYAEAGVSGLLPNDTLYRNIVDKTLAPMLREAHAEISAACSYIQTDLNKKAGLGIKAISPAIDEDKLSGLAYQVANTGEPRLRAREAGMVENFVQTAVDAYVQANIDFQKEAGLSPQITRMRGASPNPDCGFCEERVYSGEYKGPNMPEGIFMRHRHCHCIVLYDPKDGRGIQGAHSKQSYKNHQEAIVKEREYLGKLDSMSSSERKAARRAKARLQYQSKKQSITKKLTPAEKIAKAKAQLPYVMSPEKIAIRKELGTKKLAKKDPKVLMARAEAQLAKKSKVVASKKNNDIIDLEKSRPVDTNNTRNEIPLTERQREEVIEYAEILGMSKDKIFFSDTCNTGYIEAWDILMIGTDVLPGIKAASANSKVSMKGAIAHEVVGHRRAAQRKTSFECGDVRDEAQASIRAARFAEGLTGEERSILIRDAIERLRRAGMRTKDVRRELDIQEY